MKKGQIVTPKEYVPGYPIGLTTDTHCRIVKTRAGKVRVVRDRDPDNAQAWWLDADSVRVLGTP